jgi:hypothetical protein
MIFLAILFIIGGFLLRFQINKRQFNRRNAAGVEEFKSYGNAYSIKILEKIGRYAGLFLMIIGILMALTFLFGNSHK